MEGSGINHFSFFFFILPMEVQEDALLAEVRHRLLKKGANLDNGVDVEVNCELLRLPGKMRVDPRVGYAVWLTSNTKLQQICRSAGINFFEDIADVLADIQAKFTSEYPHVSLAIDGLEIN